MFVFQGTIEEPHVLFGVNTKGGGWSEDPEDSPNDSGLPAILKEHQTHIGFQQHKDNWMLNIETLVTPLSLNELVTKEESWVFSQDSTFKDNTLEINCTEVTTGLGESQHVLTFKVVPQGVLIQNNSNRVQEIDVFNMMGQCVHSEFVPVGVHLVHLSSLNKGVYIFHANMASKTTLHHGNSLIWRKI